jgi:hypothetical protein
MPAEAFEKFYGLVLSDVSLQKQLRDITDKQELFAGMVELGGELGFEFTLEDVNEMMQENIRVWLERWM